jgi:hypothetical protein
MEPSPLIQPALSVLKCLIIGWSTLVLLGHKNFLAKGLTQGYQKPAQHLYPLIWTSIIVYHIQHRDTVLIIAPSLLVNMKKRII